MATSQLARTINVAQWRRLEEILAHVANLRQDELYWERQAKLILLHPIAGVAVRGITADTDPRKLADDLCKFLGITVADEVAAAEEIEP